MQLPEALSAFDANELKEKLLSKRGADLVLNAGKCDGINAPCIQVLLAARNTWQHDGLKLKYRSPSATFLADLEGLGLSLENMTAGVV